MPTAPLTQLEQQIATRISRMVVIANESMLLLGIISPINFKELQAEIVGQLISKDEVLFDLMGKMK